MLPILLTLSLVHLFLIIILSISFTKLLFLFSTYVISCERKLTLQHIFRTCRNSVFKFKVLYIFEYKYLLRTTRQEPSEKSLAAEGFRLVFAVRL